MDAMEIISVAEPSVTLAGPRCFYSNHRNSGAYTSHTLAKILHRITRYTERPFWNWTFLILSVIAISFDPLFLYIPVINDDKKCFGLDKKLGNLAIALRSVMDSFYLIYIIYQFFIHSSAFYFSYRPRFNRVLENPYLRRFFIIDLISILPFPQVIIFIIKRGSKPTKLLQFCVIFQYVPRLLRIYPLFQTVKRTAHQLDDATFTKAAFNLLLYLLASHVFGALWYFFAIEREISCWKSACKSHPECAHASFYCHESLGDYTTFLNDFCPIQIPNTTVFNFGIYQDALQSGIVEVTDFPQKFLHSFLWGLQNLSCFGQNLQASSYVWENVFAISITLSGLVFFLYLIGNMQIYLQSDRIRSEEKRLKEREIEEWSGFKRLPENLKNGIIRHRQQRCREISGGDVESSLNNLPKGFRRTTKSALGFKLLKKMPIFEKVDRQTLEEVCDLLKAASYTEEMEIVRQGDPIEEMLFVMRGELLSMATEGGGTSLVNACTISDGDFLGQDLILWALDPQPTINDLPISTRTVRARTQVEAFVLTAEDMKLVAYKLCKRMNRTYIQRALRYYSDQWRYWAAWYIQAAWQRHMEKRRAMRTQKNEKDEWLRTGGISSSSGASDYTSQFALNSLLYSRCNGNARIPEGLPQKPEEPFFTY